MRFRAGSEESVATKRIGGLTRFKFEARRDEAAFVSRCLKQSFLSRRPPAYAYEDVDLSTAISVRHVVVASQTLPANVKALVRQQLAQMERDRADGNLPRRAINVRKALRVPSFANGRIVSWKVVEWNTDLNTLITKALAGRR